MEPTVMVLEFLYQNEGFEILVIYSDILDIYY